jgi:hypothetical protein
MMGLQIIDHDPPPKCSPDCITRLTGLSSALFPGWVCRVNDHPIDFSVVGNEITDQLFDLV